MAKTALQCGMTSKLKTEQKSVPRRAWISRLVVVSTAILFAALVGGQGSMKGHGALGSNLAGSTAAAPGVQFCNSSPITILFTGPSSPYPSTINVSNMVGTVESVTVTISNIQHWWASDVDIMLVSPDGRPYVLVSDIGGDNGLDVPVTLTLTDAATVGLPNSNGTAIASGTYKPSNFEAGDSFASPAPPGQYHEAAPAGNATFASVLNGANPNGDWKLYVTDDSSSSGGKIAGGWCLNITTEAPLPGQLQFTSANYNEFANSTAIVNVNRINGNLGAVAVDYATSNGTATGGVSCGEGIDYVATSGTLNFASGEISKNISVQLCGDTGPGTDETVNLNLTNPTGGASIGAPGTATLTIIPTSSAPATQFCHPAQIRIASSGDAGWASPYPSNIPVSGLSGTVSNVKVTLNNVRHERSEDVDILLVSPTGQNFVVMSDVASTTGFIIGTTVTLTDFAAAHIPLGPGQLSSGAYKPTNSGTFETFSQYGPPPPYNSPAPAGTATFASVFNGFDPNGTWRLYVYDDSSGSSGTIDGWCLEITTSNPSSPGQFQLATTNFSINEGEIANMTVGRTGGSVGAVTVNYATSNGTATGGTACGMGVDYISMSGTLSFSDGVASQTIPIQMCLDAVTDLDETFSVTLSSPTGGATIGANNLANVRIIHVDESIVRLAGGRDYAREGVVRTIVLHRNFNQIGLITVDYETSTGTAIGGVACTPGVDFINTSGTMTFLAGVGARSFTITTCNDTNVEPIETANITLTNAVGARLSSPSSAILHIFESWEKQTSTPSGQVLDDVHMISATEGWAVGGYGVITHTTDGGITWERQTSGTFDPLHAVYFADALHGWASGNVALYTTDGGNTWLQAYSSTGVGTVWQLTFADLNTGFAAGGTLSNTILKTTDGGRNWFSQGLPVPVRQVWFFDSLNGLAGGWEGIAVTNDGGNTWTQRPNTNGGDEWIDLNRGWDINYSPTTGTYTIAYTTNGGMTWTDVATPPGTAISKISFLDALNGWAMGSMENIIRTSDGGLSWHTQRGGYNSSSKISYGFEDIDMFDTQRGIAVGGTGMTFTTTDGGASWIPRQSGGGFEVHKIVATDARHAWASTYNGDVLFTTNGGRFWKRRRANSSGSPHDSLPAGIAFPDNQNGWISIRGRIGAPSIPSILRTRNGGEDWEDVNNAPPHNAWALDTFDGQTIVSVGFDGAGAPIVRSTDGGQTWTLTRFLGSSLIHDVDMVAPSIGYAAAGVRLIKSTDGFATWTTVAISNGWFDVSFADVNNGWALGTNNFNVVTLYHTSDGGLTWDEKPMPDAVTVHAVSAQCAWVVEHDYDSVTSEYDNATFALRTVDGGQTFTRELVSLENTSTAAYFVDPDNGWVGGVNRENPSLIADGSEIFRHGTLGLRDSAKTKFDFDGDGKADIGVFRQGNWYLQQSQNGFRDVNYGLGTDKIAPADYDGDGKTDIAVFRDGDWYLIQSGNGQTLGVQFGMNGDVPVPGDYDGDGRDDIAVFRPSTSDWYLLQSSGGFVALHFGQSGDVPVAEDYDGDGKYDVAVYRAGTWYVQRSRDGFYAVQFGIDTDVPVVGDFDGDGRADPAVFRSGVWYVQRSRDGFYAIQFGLGSDVPTPADYDGDGITDVAVFRDGNWYLQRSQAGFVGSQFGLQGDLPVPSAGLPQ